MAKKTWGTETISLVRYVLNLDQPVVVMQEAFDEAEWQKVATATLEEMRGILADRGIRVYAGIPLIVFSADELRDVYAHLVVGAWKEGRNGPDAKRMRRRIERLKRTQVML